MVNLVIAPLWVNSLAPRPEPDPYEPHRRNLREVFLKFRRRATALAGEITGSLPELTVHDVTHLDALWETAGLIAGDEFDLTPTEAFVLGGAFLVHDLAMSRAAYPEGLEALRREPTSQDMLAALLRKRLGRAPSRAEVESPDEEVRDELDKTLLRINHARQAEQLPMSEWKIDEGGTAYHLIEDPELRETYGPTIGRIAHSHWWNVDRLPQEFGEPLGAPGGYPAEWGVDALKLAALLRVADASHLDDRRAPGFLMALRKPAGVAKSHWQFQNNLLQPRREADRLVYTAKRPFKLEEAPAWWLCFDTLQVVDRELRQVDS
ncbi:MAG TPA: hypothetical protein VNZ44_19275, partial [Pyrinomonadaceae bacterium]|nr:hypothetical protein [Pyrinomonadaceae bacterium]